MVAPTWTPLDRARDAVRQGLAPVPIPHREKRPTVREWQNLHLTEQELPQYFNGAAQNMGILLGKPSGGLLDIDLDASEAVEVARAFLPPTDSIFGRASKPASHFEYRVTGPIPETKKYIDPLLEKTDKDKAMLVELRSTGCQTVWPGSTHPSGEPITWEQDGAPAEVAGAVLQQAVARVAAAALLARHWSRFARHDTTLPLAGALLRAGWATDQVVRFVEVVARCAGDNQVIDRVAAVRDTARRFQAGDPVTGLPRLAELTDEKLTERLAEWLGLGNVRVVDDAPDPTPEWPVLKAAAFHGPLGAAATAIMPHTEADPAAVLGTLLSLFGNAAGHTPHAAVGPTRHTLNENVAIVADSAVGRKGSSLGYPKALLARIDSEWADTAITPGGVGSGEGLIYAVRDPSKVLNKEGQPIDAGVADKRLLVIEEELASLLKVMSREGNITSATLRTAWDSGDMRNLVKANPLRATGAHISILGHITSSELSRYLTNTEAANGFANRFLWVCARRSKLLPRGGGDPSYGPLVGKLRQALEFARAQTAPLRRDEEAEELWEAVYEPLTTRGQSLLDTVVSRAEAHALRLSALYAVVDCSPLIRVEHLHAALAFWDYCEASARYIFMDRLGDPLADTILALVRNAGPEGMSQTALSNALGRNQPAVHIRGAVESLTRGKRMVVEQRTTEGATKPTTVYRAP